MELEIITNGAVLRRPPLLSDEDRKKVRALAVAAGIIRKRDEGFAKTLVRGQTLDILRLSLHNEFPGRFRYTTLTQDEWDAVRAYYPDKYVIEYFTGRAYGPEIRQFVKAADRTFQHVMILGTGGDRDFMILGYVPGDKTPTVLARVHLQFAKVPTINEIMYIVKIRRQMWNPFWPTFIMAILGDLLAVYVCGRLQLDVDLPMLVALLGLTALGAGIGFLITTTQHWFKRRGLWKRYSHLTNPF